MKSGVIYKINRVSGMVAVNSSDGFSIFEIISSCEFECGDVVQWSKPTALGRHEIDNITKQTKSIVFFQNHWCPIDQVDSQLFIK